MESGKDADDTSVVTDIHEEDSTIYLFGSELYCGWCLESFTCPVRLKIHCCVEHLAMCSCGRQFSDKQSLCYHVADSGCLLPPPFQWYHFLNLPVESNLDDVHISEESESKKQHEVLDGEVKTDTVSIKGFGKSIQKTKAECSPDRVKNRLGFWDSGYASTSCTRSCPTCSRSFSVISKYNYHYAVCRAKRKVIKYNVDASRYKYLINFCEPLPSGRWKCRLCKCNLAYRSDLYKHIRAKHSEVQNTKLDATCLSNFCEPVSGGGWKCRLCMHSAANRSNLYKHIRVKHSTVQNTKPDASTELNRRASAVKNITASLKRRVEKSKAGKQTLFCCVLCPYQSIRKYHCKRHIKLIHGKKEDRYIDWNRCDIALEKVEAAGDHKKVTGTVYKASAGNVVTFESTLTGKSDGKNMSLASSQSSCYKHRNDDVQFIISCFSSPAGGKPWCCQLCADQFDELEEAAVHVYNTHFSALQQWRDTRTNVSEMQPLNENSADNRPHGSSAGNQFENLSSAIECDVPNSDNGACKDKVQLSILERSSDKSEPDTGDTSIDLSDIPSAEKEVKREFTTDECNVLASSLCRLLNCCNAEPNAEMSDEQVVGIHSTESKGAVTASSPTKKATASCLNSTKTASNETRATVQLISRKCKYCHRLCSNHINCQKHEAVCSSGMILSSKHGIRKSLIQSKDGVRASSPTKKATASHLNSTKTASNETRVTMQLISRKCKYCHRLCSNRFNCQRHEAVCSSGVILSSKHGIRKSLIQSKDIAESQSQVSPSVRAVYESNIFYCARCGFSDSDQHVVSKHSKEPHVSNSVRHRAKAHPGHDYIGSMKITKSNYQCSLCGLHFKSRLKVLLHLILHSSLVQTTSKHSGLTTAS